MDAAVSESVTRIFEQWESEDRELEVRMDALRDWMHEVNQLGIPHFGETASRLKPLRQLLVQHFESEDAMIAELAKVYPGSSPEVHGVQQHSCKDHRQLLSRVDDLITKLTETVPPFESWEAAIDDVSILVEALAHHEENESESVRMLLSITPNKRSASNT